MLIDFWPFAVLVTLFYHKIQCFQARSYRYSIPMDWNPIESPPSLSITNFSPEEMTEIISKHSQVSPSVIQGSVPAESLIRSSYFEMGNESDALEKHLMKAFHPVIEEERLPDELHAFRFNEDKKDFIYYDPENRIYYFYDRNFTIIIGEDTGNVYRMDQLGKRAQLVSTEFGFFWEDDVDGFPLNLKTGRVVPESKYEALDNLYPPWLVDLQTILPPSIFIGRDYVYAEHNHKKYNFSNREEISNFVLYDPHSDIFQFSIFGDYIYYGSDIALIRRAQVYFLTVTKDGLRWSIPNFVPKKWDFQDPEDVPPYEDQTLADLLANFPEHIIDLYRLKLLRPVDEEKKVYQYVNPTMNCTLFLHAESLTLKYTLPSGQVHQIDYLGNHFIHVNEVIYIISFDLRALSNVIVNENMSRRSAWDRFYENPPCIAWDKLFENGQPQGPEVNPPVDNAGDSVPNSAPSIQPQEHSVVEGPPSVPSSSVPESDGGNIGDGAPVEIILVPVNSAKNDSVVVSDENPSIHHDNSINVPINGEENNNKANKPIVDILPPDGDDDPMDILIPENENHQSMEVVDTNPSFNNLPQLPGNPPSANSSEPVVPAQPNQPNQNSRKSVLGSDDVHIYKEKATRSIQRSELTLQPHEVSSRNETLLTELDNIMSITVVNEENDERRKEFLRNALRFQANLESHGYPHPERCVCRLHNPTTESLLSESHLKGYAIQDDPREINPNEFVHVIPLDVTETLEEQDVESENARLTIMLNEIYPKYKAGERDRAFKHEFNTFAAAVYKYGDDMRIYGYAHPANCVCLEHDERSKELFDNSPTRVDPTQLFSRNIADWPYLHLRRAPAPPPNTDVRPRTVAPPPRPSGFWDKVDRALRGIPFVEKLDRTTLFVLAGVFVSILVSSLAFGTYLTIQRVVELRTLASTAATTVTVPAPSTEIDRRMSILPID